LLSACGDDGGATPQNSDNNTTNNTTNNATNNPANNATNNPTNNPTNNERPCDGKCDVAAGERCLAGECIDRYDRSCGTDADCRDAETCLEVAPAVRACILDERPIESCPGSPGCASADGPLMAGAAKVRMTPVGFEQPRREFMRGAEFYGDPIEPTTFVDCGLDQLCPDDPGYSAPDFGEGDELMQGAWIAGFDHSRPAFRYCEGEPSGLCPADQPWAGEVAHDDLYARTLVLERGDTTIALVTVDGIGFFYNRLESIERKLAITTDIDLIVIGATHAHEAPDLLGQWGPGTGGQELPVSTGAEPWWLDFVDTKVAASIDAAYAARTAATLYAAKGDTGIDGFAVGDGRDPWVFDDDLPVMRLAGVASGETIATVYNWAQHAEVRDSDNQHITADFPGAASRYIEEGLPEVEGPDGTVPAMDGLGGVAIFFSGAAGGLVGPGNEVAVNREGQSFGGDEWEKVDAVGARVAEVALRTLSTAEARSNTALSFVSKEYTTPIENTQFHVAFFSLKLFDRDIYNVSMSAPLSETNKPAALTRVSLVQLGDVTLFTAPGEPFPETFVGGFRPDGSYPFTPVIGSPWRQCGLDFMPLGCETELDCPDGWLCTEHGTCVARSEVRCGDSAQCATGFECLAGRCRRPCVDETQCGEAFVCGAAATCEFVPALAAPSDHANPCLVDPKQANPPDLEQAPAGPYLKERMPGEVVFALCLTHDELGYLVPPYDFKLNPDGPYVIEAPGEHYCETNSTGPLAWTLYEAQITALLDALSD
jgi:hypothetical protein